MGKILFVANERFVYQSVNPLDLAELCALDGHVVAVAAPFTEESLRWNQDRGFQCIPLANDEALLSNTRFSVRASEAAQSFRPNVVVGVNPVGFVAADMILQARLAERLAYYALELVVPEEFPLSLAARWQSMRARHADLIITTGDDRADEMHRRFQLTEMPLVVANSPIRGPTHRSSELRERLRAKGVTTPRVLIYTGAGAERNGLIEATRASRLWQSDVVLALHPFGGPIEWRRALRRAIDESNGRTVALPPIPGSRETLLEYIAGADAGLVLYDYRNDPSLNMLWYTPNKAMDYISCGLPIVASDNPSLVNDIESRGVGFCCNPQEPASIAAAVDKVFDNHDALSVRAANLFSTKLNYVAQSAETRERLTQLAGD